MMRRLRTLIAQVTVALAAVASVPTTAAALTAPGVVAQSRGAELSALEKSWEDAVRRREHLVGTMGVVEESYDELVGRIERLKREGADNDLRRQRLQALLREGREIAEQLQQMQRAIVQNDEEIAELSESIVGILDAKMRRSEREMASASARSRATLVKDLNTLSVRRARYARPLPQISMRDIDDILESADEVEDPEEMLALADELQDTEQSVRQKLEWVQGRLSQLRQRKKLVRRSRTFQRQESFFEEGDRGRVVASRVPNERSNGPTVASGDQPESGQGGNNANAAPPEGDARGQDSNNQGGFESGADVDAHFDNAADPTAPTEEPVAGGGDDALAGAGDDYGGGDYGGDFDTMVVERQADPGAPARGAYFDDADLDARIDALEGDEVSLKKQAAELRKRARGLRTRARRVD